MIQDIQNQLFKPRKLTLKHQPTPIRGILVPYYEQHRKRWSGFMFYELEGRPFFVTLEEIVALEATSVRSKALKEYVIHLTSQLKQEHAALKAFISAQQTLELAQQTYRQSVCRREQCLKK